MQEKDTVELLKECNSGIKMASNAIEEVLPKIKDDKMRALLKENKTDHDQLGDETHQLLLQYGEEDKDPGMIARGMTWMKTNMKMSVDPGDDTIADLMCSGCDMGVRSLNKCLNKYNEADEQVRELTKKVIVLEEHLSSELRSYL